MNYTQVTLPDSGFVSDEDEIGDLVINGLAYCFGERTEDSTAIHVRGIANADELGTMPFAGSIVLREGRDDPEFDLALWPASVPLTGQILTDLCLCVHYALDAHASEAMMAEMNRICGE